MDKVTLIATSTFGLESIVADEVKIRTQGCISK